MTLEQALEIVKDYRHVDYKEARTLIAAHNLAHNARDQRIYQETLYKLNRDVN